MNLTTQSYDEQIRRWPESGRHILAQYDEETIVVYQAYSSAIGQYAIQHGHFGGDFKYSRMSWIKPNFLWMMYRSDWGQSRGQEVVLAIRLERTFFDLVLEQAIPSSFAPTMSASQQEWKIAVSQSDVRLQWDPDHLPTGGNSERRAIQLGLRGEMLEAFGKREILEIIDMSEFVAEQRQHIHKWQDGELLTPAEQVYRPTSQLAVTKIGLD